MRIAAVLLVGLLTVASSTASGDDAPAADEPLVYKLKPNYSYRYDFELRSGDDNDGFLQLNGSVSYGLAPKVGRPSLIDEAFKDGEGDSGQSFDVRFHGVVHGKNAPGQFIDGGVRVTPRGDSLKLQGERDYSLLSTTVGTMAFDELPPPGQTKWQATRNRKIAFVDEDAVAFPQRFSVLRYGRFSPLLPSSSPLLQRTTVNQMGVDEKVTYELTELTADKAVVKTRLTSSWASVASGKKTVELESAGQYTFDIAQNVMAKGHSRNELKVASEGIEAKIAFKMAFALQEVVSAEEMKERTAKAEVKQREDAAQRIAKSIAVLKSDTAKDAELRSALMALSHPGQKPDKREREVVSQLLNKYLKSDDSTIRTAAVRAAEDWATPANIPTLMELLKSEQSFRRGNVIQALGATGGNEKVAAVLVRLMDAPGTRMYARMALEKMGPVGEPAVLTLLKSPDRAIRDDACQILGEVGGKKSKSALEALLGRSKDDDFRDFQVKSALDKIKERLATRGE